MSLYGGIEAGGTKFVCAIGSSPEDLQNEVRFETTSPKETINRTLEYFKEQNLKEKLLSIGIGAFGPVELNRDSSNYGFITSTPKPGWNNINIYGLIKEELKIPVGFNTDVNAAALGEYEWGAGQGLNNFIYLTIGTGIGGGAIINGRLLHGLQHPEMGHIFIPQDTKADPYEGNCPFHKNCFEGLASGPAMKNRWGKSPEDLNKNHKAWDLEVQYISLALTNYICTFSPERIIIGGGIMEQKNLLPLIHSSVKKMLNNYIHMEEFTDNIEKYIVLPSLGKKAGILGALVLAKKEYIKCK
ncbi:MAG: ROK family protein [Ignavibacteriaceae bacterium]